MQWEPVHVVGHKSDFLSWSYYNNTDYAALNIWKANSSQMPALMLLIPSLLSIRRKIQEFVKVELIGRFAIAWMTWLLTTHDVVTDNSWRGYSWRGYRLLCVISLLLVNSFINNCCEHVIVSKIVPSLFFFKLENFLETCLEKWLIESSGLKSKNEPRTDHETVESWEC